MNLILHIVRRRARYPADVSSFACQEAPMPHLLERRGQKPHSSDLDRVSMGPSPMSLSIADNARPQRFKEDLNPQERSQNQHLCRLMKPVPISYST
nr:hypothetical protein CFP56_11341 [Quercus suber]